MRADRLAVSIAKVSITKADLERNVKLIGQRQITCSTEFSTSQISKTIRKWLPPKFC